MQEVECLLQIVVTADERDVMKEGDGQEVADVGLDLKEDGVEDQGEEE